MTIRDVSIAWRFWQLDPVRGLLYEAVATCKLCGGAVHIWSVDDRPVVECTRKRCGAVA